MIRLINRMLAPTGYQIVPWLEIMARQAQFQRACEEIERMVKVSTNAFAGVDTSVEDGRWRVH